jgi:hypothetical protein
MKRAVNGRMLSPKWVIESEPSTKRGRERVRERVRERERNRPLRLTLCGTHKNLSREIK